MAGRGAKPALLALAVALTGCLEYSPHALPTEASERDLNRKAIERLLADPPPRPLRFALVGDTQRSFDEAADAIEAIGRRDDVQFVVQIGDFTNVGTLPEYRLMNDIFARLPIPYLVVIGNHDQFGNGRAMYEEMFGERDFAFTLSGVRLVFYDSNSVSHDFDGSVPDLGWLAGALAPSPDHDRTLAFAHIAPGGGSLFDDALTVPLLELLAAAGVDLSMHGHAHRYDAYEQEGVRVVIADSVNHRSYVLVTQAPDGAFDFERVWF